jgi:hypothetical protein
MHRATREKNATGGYADLIEATDVGVVEHPHQAHLPLQPR